MEELLRVSRVSKSFGDIRVIEEVSLVVRRGEIVVLFGPTGCGKTTLLRMMAGVEKPSSREIAMNYRRVGFVFQDDRLVPWLSSRENVEMVCGDRERALEALKRVNLHDYAHLFPCELSGGMRKKLGIARALSVEPDLLLLDEPFSSLDFHVRWAVADVIREHSKNSGVVLVTHDVEMAKRLGSRILILSRKPSKVIAEVEPQYLEKKLEEVIHFWF